MAAAVPSPTPPLMPCVPGCRALLLPPPLALSGRSQAFEWAATANWAIGPPALMPNAPTGPRVRSFEIPDTRVHAGRLILDNNNN